MNKHIVKYGDFDLLSYILMCQIQLNLSVLTPVLWGISMQ